MTKEQILSVLSLDKNPLIHSAMISVHKNSIPSVSISSELDAEPEQVKNLVLSIFPEGHFGKYQDHGYELSEDGTKLYKILWLTIENNIVAVHFNKKAPVCQQEPQENTLPDYTSIDEIVSREA